MASSLILYIKENSFVLRSFAIYTVLIESLTIYRLSDAFRTSLKQIKKNVYLMSKFKKNSGNKQRSLRFCPFNLWREFYMSYKVKALLKNRILQIFSNSEQYRIFVKRKKNMEASLIRLLLIFRVVTDFFFLVCVAY